MRRRAEQDGILAPPAVRVAVMDPLGVLEKAAPPQVLHDELVGLVHVHPVEERRPNEIRIERPVVRDRIEWRQPVRLSRAEIVRAVSGGRVDASRSLIERHVIGQDEKRTAGHRCITCGPSRTRAGLRIARRDAFLRGGSSRDIRR